MKGHTSFAELENMPSRYIHTIYKQYTIFLKDQDAQKAAAAEDMMEEIEDGGGSMAGVKTNNAGSNNKLTAREEQIKQIQDNIKKGLENPPPEAPEQLKEG